MLLTQQIDTANYIATMESANRTTEDQLFANIDVTSYPVSSISGYPVDNTTNPNAYVAKVNGSGQKAGPSLLLKVMSGDAIDVAVKSFYINNGSNSAQNSSITDVITSLANGLAGASTAIHGNVVPITQTNGNVYNGLFNFLQNDDPNTLPTKPKAYLNWVLLDDQFNCVNTYPQSGAVPVGNAGILNTIGYAGIPITKSGYLYIWVSNETQNWDVFFDNLSVQHRSGPILEENHYYPFGLSMAGISDKAVKFNYAENFKRYNGIEYDSTFGLDDYEAQYRNLDPQTGRWWQIDPEAENERESVSPYASMSDDPVFKTDPLGDEDEDCCKEAWNAVKEFVSEHVEIFKNNTLYEVAAVKNAVSTGIDNAKSNIEAGNTIPQRIISDLQTDPFSVLDGAEEVDIVKDLSEGNNLIKNVGKDLVKAEDRAAKLSEKPRPGEKFTKAGKDATKDVNKAKNGGNMKCESCKADVKQGEKHLKGKTPPSSEAHVDHVKARSKGGSGTPDNAQVLCRKCNLKKGAK